MLSDSKVGATIAVSDLGRARGFYEGTLGLEAQHEMGGDEGAVVYGCGGDTSLFVYVSQHAGTNRATSATWEVADLAAVVDELAGKGVEFERYEDLGEVDERGIHSMGDGGGGVAWFKDPDGNIISVGQFD